AKTATSHLCEPRVAALTSRGPNGSLQSRMPKTTYSVTQAQSQLPRLIREAEGGKPIAISRHDERFREAQFTSQKLRGRFLQVEPGSQSPQRVRQAQQA